MGFILVAATILGGIAAFWFLWDKFRERRQAIFGAVPSSEKSHEKLVDFNYPNDTGLQARLESQGFRTLWCDKAKLARRLELESWEYVEEDGYRLTTGELFFLKKKESQKA